MNKSDIKELNFIGSYLVDRLKELTEESNDADIAVRYAMRFVGTWYTWGGDDPVGGFDCSGFVSEIMQAVGKIGRGERLTAQGLWDRFAGRRTDLPGKGCLVLYNAVDNPDRIVHVELCISPELSIGASGGGSQTLTKEDAIRDNAFIKIRPFRSRNNIAGFVNPFLNIV